MAMSSFSRFQEINQKRGIANQKTNGSFVLKGYPSISIMDASNNEISVLASVVNKQEKDMAYVYTLLDNPLPIGSVWTAKGLHWLISEEIVIIKDVNWHKYIGIICNVEIDGIWGYFIGPEKTHIDVKLKESFLLQSKQEPVLVMPEGFLKIGDKIMIKERGWLVQEEDSISTKGVSYYSLVPTSMSKDIIKLNKEEDIFIEESNPAGVTSKESQEGVIYVSPNEEIHLATQKGFISTEAQINIISVTANEIIFTLPYGVSEANIFVKENSQEREYVFKHKV